MTRKVLVLTYEFPPAGGGGVQRWAKMCRYLPVSGWEPVVVTADPVPRRSRDESLLADVEGIEVHRTPHRHATNAIAAAIEPLKHLRSGTGARRTPGPPVSDSTQSHGLVRPPFSTRVARWIAVPDDAAFWRSVAVRETVRVGREARVDAIVATGPPFSAMVAGARAARILGVPLVLDQRDAWHDSPVIVFPTSAHARLSERMQRQAMKAAEVVVCTSPAIAEEAARLGARRTAFIANGYDPSDVPQHQPQYDEPLKLVFMGKVFFGHSDPAPLFKAMASAAAAGGHAAGARFEIVGSWPESIKEMAQIAGVGHSVDLVPYLPHREALERTARADVGVLLIADRPGALATVPAKLYEYLAMGMRVLALGPAGGLTEQVLAETCGGWLMDPRNTEGVAARIRELAEAKASGQDLGRPDAAAVARYSRPEQASRYAAILEEITGGERR